MSASNMAKRTAAGTLALAICLGGGALALAGAANATSAPPLPVDECGGSAVVLASGVAGSTDAYAAGPLAATLLAPVVLQPPGATLGADAAGEITDADPTCVIVLGGASAVSPAVVKHLEDDDRLVVRLGGADRYATAATISAAYRSVLEQLDD